MGALFSIDFNITVSFVHDEPRSIEIVVFSAASQRASPGGVGSGLVYQCLLRLRQKAAQSEIVHRHLCTDSFPPRLLGMTR
jgi:hypothetical protein